MGRKDGRIIFNLYLILFVSLRWATHNILMTNPERNNEAISG